MSCLRNLYRLLASPTTVGWGTMPFKQHRAPGKLLKKGRVPRVMLAVPPRYFSRRVPSPIFLASADRAAA
jgi:hypothetical protein